MAALRYATVGGGKCVALRTQLFDTLLRPIAPASFLAFIYDRLCRRLTRHTRCKSTTTAKLTTSLCLIYPRSLMNKAYTVCKFFINSFCIVECNDSGKRGYFKNTTSYSLPVTVRQADWTYLLTDIYTGHACRSSKVQRDAQDYRLKSIDIPQRCLYFWKIFD